MFFYVIIWVTFLAYSEETSDRCLQDSNQDVLHVSDRCYWTISEPQNFRDAHRHCQSEGGILADIPDQEAETEIREFLGDTYAEIWIGVNDINAEGNFVNMLNETVKYTNWASGEPNNQDSSSDYGDCVRISSGKWRDSWCSRLLPALCSQKHNVEPSQIISTKPTTSKNIVQTSTQSTSTTTTTGLSTVSHNSKQTISRSPTTGLSTKSTASGQTTVPLTTAKPTSTKKKCMCPCTRMKNLVTVENEAELQTKINKMKKELVVNKSLLSSSIRKKTCALDQRPSASIVGGTLSLVFISTVVGLILLCDLPWVINFCWKPVFKRRNRKTKVMQEEKV